MIDVIVLNFLNPKVVIGQGEQLSKIIEFWAVGCLDSSLVKFGSTVTILTKKFSSVNLTQR